MSDANPYQYSETPGDDHYPEIVLLDDAGGRIEFRPEVFFSLKLILKLACFVFPIGIIAGMALGLAPFLLVASLFDKVWYLHFRILGVVFLIPSLFVIYFMPWLQFPNCFIPRIISKFHQITPGKGYLCQFTTHPSRYRKLRALLDNSDDIGVLYLEDDHILFEGDHTTAVIPYSCIESAVLKNAGFLRSSCLAYYQ